MAECIRNIALDILLQEITYSPLQVSYSVQHVSANGGSDGAITLLPTGGSGSRTYAWGDGPVTQNRSGLFAGTYTVTITDTVTLEEVDLSIQVNEPSVIPASGSFFDIPMLNSLKFINKITPDNITSYQTPDNVLFCDQYFPGFKKGVNYFQKLCKVDRPVIQMLSDFPSHQVFIKNYSTGAIVAGFSVDLVEQNVGKVVDYAVTIRNHTGFAGKSRVYFNVGAIPIPLSIGDSVQVLDNLDGFNGSYAIQEILTDLTLGVQYLVINLSYNIAATSSNATGRFDASTVDYNVYECTLNLSALADGNYYAEVNAWDDSSNQALWTSEPFNLKTTHPDTVLIRYKNVDNAFDVSWTTGYEGIVRIEGILFKRLPGGERETSRDADYTLRKISAKKQRILMLETYMLPPWLHEKLSVVFDLDYFTINGVEYQSSEGYNEPEYIDRFKLSNASIKVEQVGWFTKYNSDDLGTVNESGFILTETGFIKR